MVLICIFLVISDVEHLLMSVDYQHFLTGKTSIQVFHPFFNQVVWSFNAELYELFTYFGYKPLVGDIICKSFLPAHRLPFHFVDGFFCCAQLLCLVKLHMFIFAFISLG